MPLLRGWPGTVSSYRKLSLKAPGFCLVLRILRHSDCVRRQSSPLNHFQFHLIARRLCTSVSMLRFSTIADLQSSFIYRVHHIYSQDASRSIRLFELPPSPSHPRSCIHDARCRIAATGKRNQPPVLSTRPRHQLPRDWDASQRPERHQRVASRVIASVVLNPAELTNTYRRQRDSRP